MQKKIRLLGLIALVIGLLAMGSLYVSKRHTHSGHPHLAPGTLDSAHSQYYCPMHPTYTSDHPGDCPICGMKLVPIPADKNPASAEHAVPAAERKIAFYRNPMNAEITSPVFMKDDMGMDYIPVYADEIEDGHDHGKNVEGHAAITLSPEKQQLIGLKTTVAEKRPLIRSIHATGKVAYDPDLYNALAEYQSALDAEQRRPGNLSPEAHESNSALLRAATLRLKQLGLSEKQIDEFSGQNSASLLVAQGENKVWVYIQIYENEIGLVKPGQMVDITATAYPGQTFKGVIKSMDPNISAETRSLKVRVQVNNPQELLKLEMYVDAKIRVDLGHKLAVPEEAVLHTGPRSLVFVDRGSGRFEPREVTLGQSADGYVEVRSGVTPGEYVITAANFLVDSESRIRAAIQSSRK